MDDLFASLARSGLENLTAFMNHLVQSDGTTHIYRGHSDAAWTLRPSAFREGRYGIVNKHHLYLWKSQVARFIQPRPQNDFEWLVLAQHYGISTPLLDWTTNPMVALFFACQPTENEAPGVVVSADRTIFHLYTKPDSIEIFKHGRTQPGILDTAAMNTRTLAQDSVMSIHSVEQPEIAYNADCKPIFQIHHLAKQKVLKQLRTFGFSPERVYADIETAAREFETLIETEHARSPITIFDERGWSVVRTPAA